MVFSYASACTDLSRSMRWVFFVGNWMSSFPVASFNSYYLLWIEGFVVSIIWCAASCWCPSTSVFMASRTLFTAEYTASSPCLSTKYHSLDSQPGHQIPHYIVTLFKDSIESWCGHGVMFQPNTCFYYNLLAHTAWPLVQMRHMKHHKTWFIGCMMVFVWLFCT